MEKVEFDTAAWHDEIINEKSASQTIFWVGGVFLFLALCYWVYERRMNQKSEDEK